MFVLRFVLRSVIDGLVLVFSCAALSAQANHVPARQLDYTSFARTFLEENGLAELSRSGPAGHNFEELLDGPAFVRIDLVGLDVRFPTRALRDGDDAELFRDAVAALVEVQEHWIAWRHPQSSAGTEEDWKAIAKWVKSWSRNKLAGVQGGRSLFESLEASEAVLGSARKLAESARAEEASAGEERDPGRLLFAPDRKSYLELIALAGWLDQGARGNLWNDQVLGTTIQWIGWTQLVALEYALLPLDPKSPFGGVSLIAGDKTGLEQYAAERGAVLCLRREFHDQTVHFFEQSLAANLVIAATGKNNLRPGDWKLEKKTSGASTPAYERFVPGGNPSGGSLPPRPAGEGVTSGNAVEISLYRSTQGAEFFLGTLREGQKLGAKLASKDKKRSSDKSAHFALHSFSKNEDCAVTAPFLGEQAEKKALPPDAFLDDYEDFFRAYRSGFLHWLQHHGAGDEAASQAKFAELIVAHAKHNPLEPLDATFEQLYRQPISHEDGSIESLEWRYLGWLSKKK